MARAGHRRRASRSPSASRRSLPLRGELRLLAQPLDGPDRRRAATPAARRSSSPRSTAATASRIDRYLARTVGGGMPFRHVYLGAMALQNNASGDKFVSYVSPGTTVAPEDDPMKAFAYLFGNGGGSSGSRVRDPATVSILDNALTDLNDLRSAARRDREDASSISTWTRCATWRSACRACEARRRRATRRSRASRRSTARGSTIRRSSPTCCARRST